MGCRSGSEPMRLPRRRSEYGERGSAVPVVIACVGVIVAVALAAVTVAAIFAAHRQAQAAADLAALAGAGAAAVGSDGCERARAIAAANNGSIHACVVDGHLVSVTVVVAGPEVLGNVLEVSGRARAEARFEATQ